MVKVLSEYERGWLEALTDGEGTLGLQKVQNVPRTRRSYVWEVRAYVSNTNRMLLEKLRQIVGEGSIVVHDRHPNHPKYKTSYRFQFSRNSLRVLLPQLHLVTKDRQRILLLEALALLGQHYYPGHGMSPEVYERLVQIWAEMRRLNKRGV